ncbi:hypothetical protein C8Q74DRAFT_1402388 [Fomes fomentarius]|nr:hypothetical protein C8Q74DRAFT_1402388 [Fomes fomentarius]
MSTADSARALDEFNRRLAKTQTGKVQVRDFALQNLHLFPTLDVLAPAPMAVRLLGRSRPTALVATKTDFKLAVPKDGSKPSRIRFPDSFRATMVQASHSGALALHTSYVNFDHINKHASFIKVTVNYIVKLLAQPAGVIAKYLPMKVKEIEDAVGSCVERAENAASAFQELLELIKESQENCIATRGLNDVEITENTHRMTHLDKERQSSEEIKILLTEEVEEAKKDHEDARVQYQEAYNTIPGGAYSITKSLLQGNSSTNSREVSKATPEQPSSPSADHSGSIAPENREDPGLQRAERLRDFADKLHILLSSGSGHEPDWDTIHSTRSEEDGCQFLIQGFEHIVDMLSSQGNVPESDAGKRGTRGKELAQEGRKLATTLKECRPKGNDDDFGKLSTEIAKWHAGVLNYSGEAQLRLKGQCLKNNPFKEPVAEGISGAGAVELAVRNGQFRLSVSKEQLSVSRETLRAATQKLAKLNENIAKVISRIAEIKIDNAQWKEINMVLQTAVKYLAELKGYLNGLVMFFREVHTLVTVTLRQETYQIYDKALASAMIGELVREISGMYLELFRKHVQPGVNMLLDMSKHVGSTDQVSITQAELDLQNWSEAAHQGMITLIKEKTAENERVIEARIEELTSQFEGILPANPRIEEILKEARVSVVDEYVEQRYSEMNNTPLYLQEVLDAAEV